MALLFQLPKDISVYVLSQWCEVADLSCLDTACSSAVERPYLLKVFNSPGFDLASTVKLPELAFCVMKGMTMKSIDIAQKDFLVDFHDMSFIKKIEASKVTSFAFKTEYDGSDNKKFVKFGRQLANKSNEMTCIKIDYLFHGDWFISALQPEVLHNLTQFHCYMVNLGPTGYRHLTKHCHLLEDIDIDENTQTIPEADIIALIVGNPNLTRISLHNDPETTTITIQTVQCVISQFPKIATLYLTTVAPIPLSTINTLLSRQSSMVNVYFGCNESNIGYTCDTDCITTHKSVSIEEHEIQYSEHDLISYFSLTSGCGFVTLCGVQKLNGVVLCALFACNSASITTFEMEACPLVTTIDVVILFEKCPLLKSLTIFDCPLVEKVMIEEYLEKINRKLEQFTIK